MTTDAQKRAHAELRKRRIKAGLSPVTVWLSKAARAELRRIAKIYGSNAAVIERLLGGPVVTGASSTDYYDVAGALGSSIRRHIAPREEVDRIAAQANEIVEVMELKRLKKAPAKSPIGPVDALTGEPLPQRKAMPKGRGKRR